MALTSEFFYGFPTGMVPSRSYENRILPTNGQTFNTPGTNIMFTIPKLDRSFMENPTLYFTGRTTFSGLPADASGNPTSIVYFKAGGAWSQFNRFTIQNANSMNIDDLQYPGRLVNVYMNLSLDTAGQTALANNMLLFDSNDMTYSTAANKFASNIGLVINSATYVGQQLIVDWAIPFIGILNNSNKYYPLFCENMNLLFQLGAVNDFLVSPGSLANTTYTMSNLEIVYQVCELSQESFAEFMASYPLGQIQLKTQSHSYTNGQIAGGTYGQVDLPFSIQVNSMKQLLMIASPSDVAEGDGYGSVNLNLNEWQFWCNGITYPQRALQASRPAEAFNQLMKSMGALYSSEKPTNISIGTWRIASTAYLPGIYGAYNNSTTYLLSRGSKFFYLLDLETLNNHNDIVANGIETTGSSGTYIRFNIASPLSATNHTVHMYSTHDVLLTFDIGMGTISATI